ncbi:molybdenum cofactor guanylyltransferase MobA [Vibrio gangliei]|uniref:molybdenum cofactor guanylyltransferase MobA n=1 Tax=Vibrio gangliei TaxID=2077090 RepID=UPI000D01B905|nr:molybdenum cofactor guanylyltransferase MobA [Vibrio gangliei]
MIDKSSINWVILAGGQASRMGGSDKGLIVLHGKPLVEHIIEKLRPQTQHIMINANRNLEDYQAYAPTFSDLKLGFLGPLAGIHSALAHSENFDWVGVVPCDSPNLPHDYIERFIRQANSATEILVAFDGVHIQPVFALYKKTVQEKLTQFLENGDRKVQLFFANCQVETVDFSDCASMFINLNTPDDLLQLSSQIDQ